MDHQEIIDKRQAICAELGLPTTEPFPEPGSGWTPEQEALWQRALEESSRLGEQVREISSNPFLFVPEELHHASRVAHHRWSMITSFRDYLVPESQYVRREKVTA